MAFPIMGLLAGAGALGKIFGGAAKGAADGRMTQAQLQLGQDRVKTDQYGIAQNAQMQQGNLDLNRKGFEESARGGRAKQALIGDLLANLKDVSINIPGVQTAQISGGLRPSAMGAGGKAAAGLLNQQALLKMLEGDTFEGGKVLNAPGVQAIPKASGWEKFAGIAGLIGNLAGGAGEAVSAFKGGGGSMPSIPGIPGGVTAGMPSTMPGTAVSGLDIPDNSSLSDIIARINAITSRSEVEGRR